MKKQKEKSETRNESAVNTIVKQTLYLGNYGYPTNLPPVKIDVRAANFIEGKLDKYIKLLNTASWAEQKLKIIADMLEDRDEQHLCNELRDITEKLKSA